MHPRLSAGAALTSLASPLLTAALRAVGLRVAFRASGTVNVSICTCRPPRVVLLQSRECRLQLRVHWLHMRQQLFSTLDPARSTRLSCPLAIEARPGDLVLLLPDFAGEAAARLSLVLQKVPGEQSMLLHVLCQAVMVPTQLTQLPSSVAEGDCVRIPESMLRTVLIRFGLDPSDHEVARLESAARTLAHEVPLSAVDAVLRLREQSHNAWGSLKAGEAKLLTSLRRAGSTTPSDSWRVVTSLSGSKPLAGGEEMLEVASRLAPDGLTPGDLLTSVLFLPTGKGDWQRALRWTEVTEGLDTWLGIALSASHSPGRLDGQTEHRKGDHSAVSASLRARVRPLEPINTVLTSRFELPLEVGGTNRTTAWQTTLYFSAPTVSGWALNCLPPVTRVVAVVSDLPQLVLVEYVMDVHHRGRARIFSEDYLDHVPAGSEEPLPQPWVDDPLRKAVGLVDDPSPVLAVTETGALRSEAVSALFDAAVQAKAALGRQQLAISKRESGARWKIEIQRKEVGILCRPSRQEDGLVLEAARWVLFSPTQHYLSELDEARRHLAELNSRATEIFGVVSAMSDRALLARTDAARRAGIVVGFVTSILAVIAVFAALAAIPISATRAINPIIRNVSLAGLLVVGALLVGLTASHLAGWLSKRRARVTHAPPPRPRTMGSLAFVVAELTCMALAVTAFVWGVVSPSLSVVVGAWVLAAAPLFLHIMREEY